MRPRHMVAMLLVITAVAVLAVAVPAMSYRSAPDYCTDCHALGGGVAVDEVGRDPDRMRVTYQVRGAPEPGVWAVFDPSGSKVTYGDTAFVSLALFGLPMDGQTYHVFWVASWDGSGQPSSMVCAGKPVTTPPPPDTTSSTTTTTDGGGGGRPGGGGGGPGGTTSSTTTTTSGGGGGPGGTSTTTTTTTPEPETTTTTTTQPQGTTTTTLPSDDPLFADVSQAHPYYGAIQQMAKAGILSGYPQPDGTALFRPSNNLWRAQFAKLVCGAFDIHVYEALVPRFSDMGPDDPDTLYPHDYVEAAATKNIIKGVTPTNFEPYTDVTRAQMVTMVVRAAQNLAPGALPTPPAGYQGTLGGFSTTHQENMRLAEYNGLLAGLVSFGPAWDPWYPVSRGEVAQVLVNWIESGMGG